MSDQIDRHSSRPEVAILRPGCPQSFSNNHAGDASPAAIDLYKSQDWHGSRRTFPAKQHLFHQGDRADSVFMIEWGTAFTYSITSTGDRRIVAIYTTGDLVGVLADDEYRLSCQCASPVETQVFGRNDFFLRARANGAAAVWLEALKEHSRAEDHILRLGASAMQKVAGFILDRTDMNCATNRVQLNMDRRVIADYLSLTIETVSRIFTELKDEGLIGIENVNTIHIVDYKRLVRRARG